MVASDIICGTLTSGNYINTRAKIEHNKYVSIEQTVLASKLSFRDVKYKL